MNPLIELSSAATILLASIIGPMIGVGGGFVIVPVLTLLIGIPMHQAIAISLISIASSTLTASARYSRSGLIDFKTGASMEAFTVSGALLGARFSLMLEEGILKTVFGIFLIYVAYKMIKGQSRSEKIWKGSPNLFAGYFGSFLAGIASGLLGIGGGVLKMPILVLLFGLPTKVAIATSVFMISITSASAVMVYYLKEVLNPTLAMIGIFSAGIGARIGSAIALKIRPEYLRRIFGLMMLTFSIFMILEGVLG